MSYRSSNFRTIWASASLCSHRDQGEALDFSRSPGTREPSDPAPTLAASYFSEKRILNLGGRFRAADQTLAFPTLDPLRLESDFLHRRILDECAALFSWHQGEALDETDTLEVTIASAECADRGGLRYPSRSVDSSAAPESGNLLNRSRRWLLLTSLKSGF